MERLFIWAASILYGCAFLYVLLSVAGKRPHSRFSTLFFIAIGFALQTTGLYLRGLEVKRCPLGNPFELVQFITWSAILLYMAIGPAFRVSLLGFFSAGMAALLSLLSLLMPGWDHPYERSIFGDNPWIEAHAATATFSYGVFGILALTSIMFLLQNHGLKTKRTSGLFSFLPSIVQLNQINARLLMTGVAVLTFSILIGAYYWIGEWDQVSISKSITTLSTWFAYFIILLLHKSNRLLSNKFAWSCLLLFGLALISLWPIDASRTVASADIETGTQVSGPPLPSSSGSSPERGIGESLPASATPSRVLVAECGSISTCQTEPTRKMPTTQFRRVKSCVSRPGPCFRLPLPSKFRRDELSRQVLFIASPFFETLG